MHEANAWLCVFGLAAVSSGTPAIVKGVSADRSILKLTATLLFLCRAIRQNGVLSLTARTTEPPDDKMPHWLTKSSTIKLKKKKDD